MDLLKGENTLDEEPSGRGTHWTKVADCKERGLQNVQLTAPGPHPHPLPL